MLTGMWTFATIREHAARSGDGAVRFVTIVQRQPSWITRAALGAALLMFAAVVLLLVVPALLVAMVVFTALAVAHATVRSVRSLLRLDGDGRRNVRVISRH